MKSGALEKWLRNGQGREELEDLNWEGANALGVFLQKTLDGLYLSCVDFDMPEERWRPLLKHLPITKLERTPRGGLHAYYYSVKEPERFSVELEDGSKIELLFNKFVIMHPSEGYLKLNDNSIRIIDDANNMFTRFYMRRELILELKHNTNEKGATVDDGMEIGSSITWRWLKTFSRDRLAYDSTPLRALSLPFSCPADKHPSFISAKDKGYFYDFHDGKAYSLKNFLSKVGLLSSEKEENPRKL
ncbi:MAG: hypothetical protein L2C94_002195 [Aigarchaeota archaeon]|nr:hypothetical protein [Candidatus Wolframiiraptor gerlachensis]